MTLNEMLSEDNMNRLLQKPLLDLRVRLHILQQIKAENVGDERLSKEGGVNDQITVLETAIRRKLERPLDQVVGLKTLELHAKRVKMGA